MQTKRGVIVGAAIGAMLVVACSSSSSDDANGGCTQTTKGASKNVLVGHDALCNAEKTGALGTFLKIQTLTPALRPADIADPSSANRDVGFDDCAQACGDAKYQYCVIANEYDAFTAAHPNGAATPTTCPWADTKGATTLVCYELVKTPTTCSNAVG